MATASSLANRTWGQQDSMAGVFGLVLGVGAGSGNWSLVLGMVWDFPFSQDIKA